MGNRLLYVFLLWGAGPGLLLVPCVLCLIDEYHFINMSLTWAAARQYCRKNFTDLATIESDTYLNMITVPEGVEAWIGLSDHPAAWKNVMGSEPNSWRWSATEAHSPGGYQKWIWYEPNKANGIEFCVFIQEGTWRDSSCSKMMSFICLTVQSSVKEFVYINNTPQSWSSARDYCRQHYLDLAMIESEEENQALAGMSGWIGLYRRGYVWSDGSNSSYRHWNKGLDGGDCIAMTSTRLWIDKACTLSFPFICHKVDKRSFTYNLKLRVQSSAELLDPSVRALLLQQLDEILQGNTTGMDLDLRWGNPPTKEKYN